MTDEQLRQAWEIFRHAADLPLLEQREYVRSGSSDPVVVEEVLALMSKHSISGADASDPARERDDDSDDPVANLGVGSSIGHYTITGLLGRGGLGVVFSARDTVLGRTVALKVLTSGSLSAHSDLARQIREATAASSLNHPNIVSIYQVVEDGHRAAIAMELVEGKSLRKLGGHPLPLDNLCHVGIQICQALAAAHRQGIIHRDIKPENAMLRPDGIVKVLDFGLARVLAASTLTSASEIAVGTLRYMSPEQMRGARLTGSSDVFSLGLVLYELACARHPFDAESPLEVAHAIATSDPAPPTVWNSFILPGLEKLILSMLARDPARRPSAEDVAGELAAISRGERAPVRDLSSATRDFKSDPGSAQVETTPKHPVPRGSSSRWRWGLAIACLALAGGTVVWLRTLGKVPAALVPGEVGVVAATGPDDPIPPRTFFGVDRAGNMLVYRDDSNDEGGPSRWIAQSVAAPRIDGVNFASFELWISGGDGVLYAVDKDKTVTYFRLLDPWRNKGAMRWSSDSNTVIGKLPATFVRAAGMSRPVWITPKQEGSPALEREWETGIIRGGTIFTSDQKGRPSLQQHGWSDGGKPTNLADASAWFTNPARSDYVPRFRGPTLPPRDRCLNCQILEGGSGLSYAINSQGDLLKFRRRPGGEWVPTSGQFARGAFGAKIGHGWQGFRSVLVEPGSYQIEGYISTERLRDGGKLATLSVEPGETVKVRASTFSSVYSVRLLRLQRSRWEDSGRGNGLIEGWPVGTPVKVEAPVGGNFKKPQNYGMHSAGAAWRGDGADVTLPLNAPSGIYAAELTTPSGGRYLAPFVVRPPKNRRNQIAVIANTTTWNAYNQWGGGSRFVVFQSDPGRPYELSYERPLMDAPLLGGVNASPGLTNRGKREFNQLTRAEVWVTTVLDGFAAIDRKYDFDVFSDVDLHAAIDRLTDYKVLLLQTLPQFWTDRMRDHLDSYLAAGGHLIYLGGRGLSERVVISGEGRLQLPKGPGGGCRHADSIDRGLEFCPGMDLFRWQSKDQPDGRSERAVLGLAHEAFSPPIDFAKDGDYFTIWGLHSFLFARTGLNRGAGLGNVRGVNADLRAADGESNGQYSRGYCPEIAGGRCSATHTTLVGDLLGVSPAKSKTPTSLASIVFRSTNSKSGWVFSIGSISVGGVLAIDPTLQQILRNALDAGLADAQAGRP